MYRVYLDAIILILKIRDDRNKADPKVTMIRFIQLPDNFGFDGEQMNRLGTGMGRGGVEPGLWRCVYVLLTSLLTHHMAYFLVHSRASSLYFSLSVL